MAKVNLSRVKEVAEFLKKNPPKGHGMNFYSITLPGKVIEGALGFSQQLPDEEKVLDTMYPSLNHPQAIDFFFFACLHQHGFWSGDDKGYVEPLIGRLRDPNAPEVLKEAKGSDLLWKLFKRALDTDPRLFEPERLANISPQALAQFFFTDDVGTPWPDFEQRFALTRQYGRWLLDTKQAPASIVQFANNSPQPLRKFLAVVKGQYAGSPFKSDYFAKKQLLLAMILANRPERFLKVDTDQQWPPIVDYHLMRVALRLGLVELAKSERQFIADRLWVSQSVEERIRQITFQAVDMLIKLSGLPMSAIDEALWMARKYCPEMTEPDCERCMFTKVCAKRTELFQPVYRTTAY